MKTAIQHARFSFRDSSASSRTTWYRPMKWFGVAMFAVIVLGAAWRGNSVTQHYQSFVTRTVVGAPVHWVKREIVLVPIQPMRGISSEDFSAAISGAALTWNSALRGSEAPKLRVARMVAANRITREDTVNTVVLRSSAWCPDDVHDKEHCYDRTRTALTNLYLSHDQNCRENGELREADIEINGVDFKWSIHPQASDALDLRAVVTHEFGHVLGLAHSCREPGEARSPLAGLGTSRAPLCTSAPAIRPIMYPAFLNSEGLTSNEPGTSEADALSELYAHWAVFRQ
jgi:hypothetical protein